MGDNEYKDNYKEEEEVEPVKLSKKVTCTICVIVVFILIIVLFCVRGCSITKKVKSSTNQSDTTIAVQESTELSTTKEGEATEKFVENSANSEDMNSGLSNENNSSENLVKNEDEEVIEEEKVTSEAEIEQGAENKGIGLTEVQELALNEEVNATGLVSSKVVYRVDNSYLYEVKIITLKGDNDSITCKYYCPKKTWDALVVGDSVSITYQTDTNGNTSVTSISK